MFYHFSDGSFSRVQDLTILDFNHNFLMDIEENVLTGINITVLNLAHNAFRRLPAAALRKLAAVTTLVLDGALMPVLEAGALGGLPVKFLSLSSCPLLAHLEAGSLEDLPLLETLTLNGNPALAYVHPGALAGVPRLIALDLTNNNLSALEDLQPYAPSLRSLYLAGNVLRCHCGLRWLQGNLGGGEAGASAAANVPGGGFVVQDGAHVRCSNAGSPRRSPMTTLPLAVADLNDCGPFILPLFPAEAEADMGHNISWACRPVGSGGSAMTVTWHLPNGTALAEPMATESEMDTAAAAVNGNGRAAVRPGRF